MMRTCKDIHGDRDRVSWCEACLPPIPLEVCVTGRPMRLLEDYLAGRVEVRDDDLIRLVSMSEDARWKYEAREAMWANGMCRHLVSDKDLKEQP